MSRQGQGIFWERERENKARRAGVAGSRKMKRAKRENEAKMCKMCMESTVVLGGVVVTVGK